jgi:hypothetical protein
MFHFQKQCFNSIIAIFDISHSGRVVTVIATQVFVNKNRVVIGCYGFPLEGTHSKITRDKGAVYGAV